MTDIRNTTWWRMAWHALPVYVLSRLCVLAGAAVVAAELRVDANLADERSLPYSDPHVIAPPTLSNSGSAVRPMLDVLTSWDGQWYMDIVRNGYPRVVPHDVTYHMDEARAAFFPLFPMLGKAADTVLPGGDTHGGAGAQHGARLHRGRADRSARPTHLRRARRPHHHHAGRAVPRAASCCRSPTARR